MTSSKCLRRYATESEIMATFSSSVVPSAEGADLRALEDRVLHALEEAQVLGIRPGPAALDVVHAELVEAVRDTHLVLHGEGHALALGAVAERGVVDLDLARHGGHIIPPPPGGCQVMLGGVIAALMAMVVLVAAFVKGAIGFGFPALGTPLLSLVVDVKTAVVVLILPNIVMDGIQFARRGTLLSTVRRFWVLLAAGAVGVVLGTRALVLLSPQAATLILGAFVLGYVALNATGLAPRVPAHW